MNLFLRGDIYFMKHRKVAKIAAKIQNYQPKILGSQNFSKYSVFLPLIEKNDDVHILFEVRAHHLRRQPGQICFPGGRIDPEDKNEKETAIRETCEELGIETQDMNVYTALDYVVSPTGSIIHPFAGKIYAPEKINPNPSEVAETFTVPITFFQETKPEIYKLSYEIQPEKDFPIHLLQGGPNYQWQKRESTTFFYYYQDKVIWGLTAKILDHFLQLIK